MTTDHSESIKERRFAALLGPLATYFEDPEINNIVVNADDSIWIERAGLHFQRASTTMDQTKRIALISAISNTQPGPSINTQHARLSADMPAPYRGRFTAKAPPIATWTITIRIHPKQSLTLEDYLAQRALSPHHYALIIEAIKNEQNIVIAGNTNSGKTTMLEACLFKRAEYQPHARIVIVQDRQEIHASAFGNKVILLADVYQAEKKYGYADALEDALRESAQYLIWGEVRDASSAIGLLMASNTGSRGIMLTTHANSCLDALHRLETLIQEGGHRPIPQRISTLAQVVIYLERNPASGQRRVTDVQSIAAISEKGVYTVV